MPSHPQVAVLGADAKAIVEQKPQRRGTPVAGQPVQRSKAVEVGGPDV